MQKRPVFKLVKLYRFQQIKTKDGKADFLWLFKILIITANNVAKCVTLFWPSVVFR